MLHKSQRRPPRVRGGMGPPRPPPQCIERESGSLQPEGPEGPLLLILHLTWALARLRGRQRHAVQPVADGGGSTALLYRVIYQKAFRSIRHGAPCTHLRGRQRHVVQPVADSGGSTALL